MTRFIYVRNREEAVTVQSLIHSAKISNTSPDTETSARNICNRLFWSVYHFIWKLGYIKYNRAASNNLSAML